MTLITADTYLKILGWIQGQGESAPEAVKLYGELLRIQLEAKVAPQITLTKELIHERLASGVPLLRPDDLSGELDGVSRLFHKITDWALLNSDVPPQEAAGLMKFSENLSLLKEAIGTWFAGHSLEASAKRDGVDPGSLTSLLSASLKPFLAGYARVLLAGFKSEDWRRRYCPVCGGKPDFAYLDKENGARWLLCGRCDAEWLFVRLECPFCGTQNQNQLAYLVSDEEPPHYRLYVCNNCCSYIKAVDLRAVADEVLLPLERVLTLDMDRTALEKGYKPG
ncbi:MAG: formate dehydrogenase accessory protein FdhE [Chloroflexota bacterium]